MGLFGKRQFDLRQPALRRLLVEAVNNMNYGAVQDMYVNAKKASGGKPTWDWWIDRCLEAEDAGDSATCLLGVQFAYAANVEPWGDLSSENYDRLRPIRDRLQTNS